MARLLRALAASLLVLAALGCHTRVEGRATRSPVAPREPSPRSAQFELLLRF